MSVNDAKEEMVKNNQENQPAAKAVPDFDPDEPIMDNGVNYDVYAEDDETPKASDENVNFSSEDIAKREKTEYFVNIEGADKLKRAEEAAERKRAEQRLKEAKKSQKAAKAEEKHDADKRLKETKKARRKIQAQKTSAFIKKWRKVIIPSAAAIALVIIAIITIPIIQGLINQAETEARVAEEKQYVATKRNAVTDLFAKVVGNTMTKEELEKEVKANKLKAEYSDTWGRIYGGEGSREEIEFSIEENGKKIAEFVYYKYFSDDRASVYKNGEKYACSAEETENFNTADEAIDRCLLAAKE